MSASSSVEEAELIPRYKLLRHGAELARPPLSEAKSPYLLYKLLQEPRPRIDTSKQAVKTWFAQYRRFPDEAGERGQFGHRDRTNDEILPKQYG